MKHLETRTKTAAVSTVELAMPTWLDLPYETCIFWNNGDSTVAQIYRAETDAQLGHKLWSALCNTYSRATVEEII